jgi:epidermal growth factor receptor substrate 15
MTEFIIAMHLLTSYKTKTLTALPQSIPAGLYEAASRRPGPVPARTPTGPIPRQTSGSSGVRAPAGRQFTPPVSGDWVISSREKVGYDNLFDKVDTAKLGSITGDQAVVFFSESGLSSEVLAQIWDLANVRRQDQLNRDEFAVAMYLIRNQGRKPKSELPSELPANLIPPSLRGMAATLPTAPAPEAQPIVPPPPKSNTDDLFGLDAFTSSPSSQVRQQPTGSSSAMNRSSDIGPFGDNSSPRSLQHAPGSAGEGGFFKSFAPTSSFGQALATQSTGASATSSTAPKQTSLMDDLLGDNDPEISKKFTKETADLANMQNQIGTLRTQMQAVQNKKSVAEGELASSSGQRRELEVRLQQFRAQYEQEAKSLKDLENQLSSEKAEINQIGQKAALAQASVQDVQNRHRDVQSQLSNSQREIVNLKDRIRQMNEYISQTEPEVEKMQSELRRSKGLVAIHKKQAEKLEEEKSQLDRTRAELSDLPKAEGSVRPPVSREATTGSAVSPSPSVGSSTNPFMRRSPQASVDNTMTPSGFTRTMSNEGNKFDNIFSQAFSSPTNTSPTNTFRQETFSTQAQSGPSIKSSEPDVPTPSTSPPLSAYQESPQLPAPLASRQITSKDLPLVDKTRHLDSTATSVQVETPLSRYEVSTPTNPVASSPKQPSMERAETSRSGMSAGESLFDRNVNASSPVASASSEATKKSAEPIDMFQNLGSSREVTRSLADLQPNQTGGSGSQVESPSATRTDPFSISTQNKIATGDKGDIEAAFASVGKAQNRQATDLALNGSDPVAKFNSEFPPIPVKEEFPPIKDLKAEESETDSDVGGFEDDFTKASPPPNKGVHDTARTHTSGGNDLDSFFSKPSTSSAAALDFGGPLSSAPKMEAMKSTTGSGSQGEALFGSKSSTSATGGVGSSSMFSTSPPETSRTSNQSDTFESAVSRQSSTNKEFSPIEPIIPQVASNAPKFSSFDTFSGFEDLADAKELDERADEDLFFGSHHGDDHEFSPSFDSPSASASQLPKSSTISAQGDSTTRSKGMFPAEDAFGDFEHDFAKSTTSQTQEAAAAKSSTNAWDALMKGIDVDDHEGHATLPEAPSPPRPNMNRTETTEHDDPILKRLTSMGYPRPLALSALEKFDYDLDKVRS